MTNNPSNQPFEPFHVQSNLLKNTTQSGPQQPGGGADGPNSFWTRKLFGSWDMSVVRWLALPLFALVYCATQQLPDLRPATIFVLLVCLLSRMEKRDRALAGVPLTLAAFRLVYQMTVVAQPSVFQPGVSTPQVFPTQTAESWLGMPWVPLFLAICIFYLPLKATVTGKILSVGAICLLISGLLPGSGYVAIFGMIQYTLFIGVVVGLIADHTSHANGSHTGAIQVTR
jgi:hypothetical protein